MAVFYAYGAATNDPTSLSAWNSQRDGGGSAPGAFSNSDTYYMERAPAVGGDWVGGDMGTTGLGTLIITYGGPIASAGAPLLFGIVTKLVIQHYGSGYQYLHPRGTSSDDDWTLCQIISTGAEGKVVLNGGSSGACDALVIGQSARYEIGTNFTFTSSTGYLRANVGSNGTIAGTGTIPIAKVSGQIASNSRPITALSVKQGGRVRTVGTGGAIAALDVDNGGKYVHHAQGTIALSEVQPGGEATAKGSPYTPAITARILWGGKNFEDTPAISAPTDIAIDGK